MPSPFNICSLVPLLVFLTKTVNLCSCLQGWCHNIIFKIEIFDTGNVKWGCLKSHQAHSGAIKAIDCTFEADLQAQRKIIKINTRLVYQKWMQIFYWSSKFFSVAHKTMCIRSRWSFRSVTLSFSLHTFAWTPSWSSAVCFLVIEPFSPYWSAVSSRQLYEGDLLLLFKPLFSVLLVLKHNLCLLSIPTVQLRYWYIICDPGRLVSQFEKPAK